MVLTKRKELWKLANHKKKTPSPIGVHLIADFWFAKKIEKKEKIEQILFEAAKKAGNTPLKVLTYYFQPQGFTSILLLSESHIALHSWPEFNYLAVDIFTCGQKTMPQKALSYLKQTFQPKKVKVFKIQRGRATGK